MTTLNGNALTINQKLDILEAMNTTPAPITERPGIPDRPAIPDRAPAPDSSEALRKKGLIRAHGIIPITLNDRFKAMARQQGKNADQLIGELIETAAADVARREAEQEVQRLRERFGPDWMDLLSSVSQQPPTT
jgi:hypothetical protein